ncbi:PKD domain-containing protein [Methanosphaerula subterraneus]|uniref:PKD domain-containing protein n=1 Tax=Methanosphaerula subterraneus TaxID=3350244 RepID=UPI003F856107
MLLCSAVQTVSADGGYVYSTQWDTSAALNDSYYSIWGIATDSAGNVYVADSENARIKKYDSSGGFLQAWGNDGLEDRSRDGQFNQPHDVAVDSAGNVYVADTYNSRIQKFDSNGGYLAQWNGSASAGGQLREPRGVAVDSAGNVYVADTGNNRVQTFDAAGTFLQGWGSAGSGDGQFSGPIGVAVDSTGNVYVADMENSRIQKFNPSGGFSRTMGSAGSGDGHFSYPVDVAVDRADNVYVADWLNNRVQKFDASGTFITTWGNDGSASRLGDGQFGNPQGVAVDSAGNVYVTDNGNNRVQKFAPETPPPAPAQAVTAGFYAFGHVGQAPYSVRFLDQSIGSPTVWTWDFGDGSTSTEQNPTHVFNKTGACNVALTASNDLASDTAIQYRCIIVNTVPVANFTANATAGRTPFTVEFADQSTGASGYQWQFGDEQMSTEQNPVHTYSQPGTYTVTLVVSGADYGSVYTQKSGYITVTNPPTVGFSANVTAGLAPLGVRFNESVNGSVQYYYWQFGDGATSFEPNPVHVYDTAGKYTVSLYAIGPNGTQVKTVDDCVNVTDPVTSTLTTLVPTNTTMVPTVTTVAPTVTGLAYNGPHTIPGTLQAEDYEHGGEGIAYHDTTAGNEGGVYRQDDVDIEVLDIDHSPNVGWIRAGEWLAYTVNVTTAGTYDAGFRVASSHAGSSVQVYLDDGTTPVAMVNVPNTGDWPVFRTVPVQVTLPAGQHRLKLAFPTDYVNINWIGFAQRG